MTSSEGGRFPWGLTAAVVPALAILIALGVWQSQRLAWKEGLIAAAETASAKPAAPLADVLAAGGDGEFRRVVVDCPGLETAPYVELRTIEEGEPGLRLVSACRAAGRTWLMDRGFVPETLSSRPPQAASATPTRVTAEIRTAPPPGPMTPPAEGRMFYGRDNAAMARALGIEGPVEARTLYALTSSNPEWPALKPSAPPAAFSNNHLGYALTWFGLAGALAAVYVAMLRRRRKP